MHERQEEQASAPPLKIENIKYQSSSDDGGATAAEDSGAGQALVPRSAPNSARHHPTREARGPATPMEVTAISTYGPAAGWGQGEELTPARG